MLYMTEEMSFKCLLDVCGPVLLKDIPRNPIKRLWWSFFANIVNDFQLLTIFAKKLHHRCSSGF